MSAFQPDGYAAHRPPSKTFAKLKLATQKKQQQQNPYGSERLFSQHYMNITSACSFDPAVEKIHNKYNLQMIWSWGGEGEYRSCWVGMKGTGSLCSCWAHIAYTQQGNKSEIRRRAASPLHQ